MIAYNSRRNGGLFMKKVNLTLEEAELMNYDDIAHLILEANGKKMKINDLFAEVEDIILEDEEVEGDEEMYDEEMNKADDDVQDDDLSDLVIVDDIEDEANL